MLQGLFHTFCKIRFLFDPFEFESVSDIVEDRHGERRRPLEDHSDSAPQFDEVIAIGQQVVIPKQYLSFITMLRI